MLFRSGMVGDAIDLIPFVTGVGEATRAIKTTKKFINNSDDVIKSTQKLTKVVGKKQDVMRYYIKVVRIMLEKVV